MVLTHLAPSPAAGDLLRDGARDMLPLALGLVPFGLVIGAAVAESSMDDLAGWAGAFLIAAGAAHLAVVEMVDSGASPIAIIATAVIINARLAVFSAGLAPWLAHEPARRRRILAYFVIDPTYLVAVERFERDDPGPDCRRWYYLGAGVTLFSIWTVAVTTAVLVGNRLPANVRLDLAGLLVMAGLLAVTVTGRAAWTAAAVAAAIAVSAAGLPFSSGTFVAIVAGSVAGAARVGRTGSGAAPEAEVTSEAAER